MSKGFSTMQDNVANFVQDTSAAMKTLIGVWINDAYHDAGRRFLWNSLINEDHTFETVVDQAEYTLESDFGEEIIVFNIADGRELTRFTVGQWWKRRGEAHTDDVIQSGDSVNYVILEETSKIKLDPPPDVAETIAMPYKAITADLSGSTAPSITNIEAFLEAYATSMALAYKKQYAKADYFLSRSDLELRKLMDYERHSHNQRYQMIIENFRLRSGKSRMLGENSYDSL